MPIRSRSLRSRRAPARSPADRLVAVRVWPRPYGRYFIQIEIYRTLAAMRARMHALDPQRGRARWIRGLAAGCWGSSVDHARRTGDLGTLLFARARLGGGIVSHEMFHATLRYANARRLRLTPARGILDRTDEETLATVHGELVRIFYCVCENAGIIPAVG